MTLRRIALAGALVVLPLTALAAPAQAAPNKTPVPKGYSGNIVGNPSVDEVQIKVTCPEGRHAEVWVEAAQEQTTRYPFVWISTATVNGQIATGHFFTCTGKTQKFTLPWSWEIVGEPLHKGPLSFINIGMVDEVYGPTFTFNNKKVV